MSAFNFYRQPLNIALAVNNEVQANRLTSTSATSIQDGQQGPPAATIRRPDLPEGCPRDQPIPASYWTMARVPGIAICGACHHAFVLQSPLADRWQCISGNDAVCDMPITAVCDAWQDLIARFMNCPDQGNELIHSFRLQYNQSMEEVNVCIRHIEALKSTIGSLEGMAAWNPAISGIITDKNNELMHMSSKLRDLTGAS